MSVVDEMMEREQVTLYESEDVEERIARERHVESSRPTGEVFPVSFVVYKQLIVA